MYVYTQILPYKGPKDSAIKNSRHVQLVSATRLIRIKIQGALIALL